MKKPSEGGRAYSRIQTPGPRLLVSFTVLRVRAPATAPSAAATVFRMAVISSRITSYTSMPFSPARLPISSGIFPAKSFAVAGILPRRVSTFISGTVYSPAIFSSRKNGTGAATASAPSSASSNAAVSRTPALRTLPHSPHTEISQPLDARICARQICL